MVLNLLHWRSLSSSYLLKPTPPLFRFSFAFPFTNLSSFSNKQFIKNTSKHNSSNPKVTSFLRLFDLCRNIENLKPLGSVLIVRDLMRDEYVVAEFIISCFHLGAPELALSAFEAIEKPSVFLQNLMIRRLCDHGLFEDVLCVYLKCRVLGCPSDDFTFPFVIKACSALGAVWIAEGVHCIVLRTGFEENLVIQTALVDFYAKTGRMVKARLVLDKISQPDLVTWNALISGYSLNGFDKEVFEVLRQILEMGLKPNVSTFASIIPLCTRMKCLDIGKSIHGFVVKSGFSSDEFLTPALISMYAGGGNLFIARDLFDSAAEKNVVIWNSMISAYAQNQKSSEAFKMFQQMLKANMQPNVVTFVSIIPCCENSANFWYGKSLHAHVMKYRLDSQLSVATALLSMYAKLGDLNSADFIFYQMPRRNLLSWNSMISGYGHNGLWEASMDAFCDMQFEGFDPDAISIVNILSACSKLEAILLGKAAHAFSFRKEFDSILNISNALLAFYSDCGKLSSSFKLFQKMPLRNAISWNTLISGCVHNGDTKKAVALLHKMQQEKMELDLVTLISIIPICRVAENLIQGMTLHGYAIKTGFACDVSLVNALISMYFNCGDINAGKFLFEVMPWRSIVSWNALITGYRFHYLQNEVMASFCQMIGEGQKPNYVTLLNLLPSCRTLLQGKSIHAFAVRTGVIVETPIITSLISMYARFENINSFIFLFEMGGKEDIALWNAIMSVYVQTKNAKESVTFFFISNALIDLFARCGNISIAKKIFEGLSSKDAVSWSTMINGYGLHGDSEAALALLSQMRLSGMKPDGITYASVLSACSHGGFIDQGWMIFNSMVEEGVPRRMEHYACMVDLLGRTGQLNEAYDFVEKLPCKPSVSLLESLLAACIIHGNVKLGEKICSLLFELDPKNSGSYVMLYNIYAAAGRWMDANRVRSDMEERQLRKIPGFSLVEGNRYPVE
ncbi:Pentatricopeptide repeat-containing protein, mitochondrial [Vitis vinifera]|uniref:Pentatricopeptide repeat-containing protein, mitochondrial n=1 Tax=Vitis vinifera TaxID=29760 RepID=A0A438F5V0_VITVI|nr:Pentatricopeptide repeat-containing protein, mitochondrial [Vitis vinifera]